MGEGAAAPAPPWRPAQGAALMTPFPVAPTPFGSATVTPLSRESLMGFVQEFKAFAMRGNVVDMAVGIVIGAAFGKIVSSFVADVLMPPIGMITGGVDFSDKKVTLQDAVGDTPAVTLNWGLFVNTVVDFVIVAFAIFLVVKLMNASRKKEEAAPPPPPKPSDEIVLLTQIRDALKAR